MEFWFCAKIIKFPVICFKTTFISLLPATHLKTNQQFISQVYVHVFRPCLYLSQLSLVKCTTFCLVNHRVTSC